MKGIKQILRQPLFLSLYYKIRFYSVSSTDPKCLAVQENNVGSLDKNITDNSHYYIEDGLRKIYPYYHHLKTFCKGRWFDRKIVDVYWSEFALVSKELLEKRITKGSIKVNGKIVDLGYTLKDGDVITSDIHRHELPVLACPIEILFEDDDFLVVDKPPSIPIHPCGLYCKNSLQYILSEEYDKHKLYILYRLDRLASGVLVFAKSSEKSRQIHEEAKLQYMNKEYVCRVEGNFPDGTIVCNKPIKQYFHKVGVSLVDPNGKEAATVFKKLSFNGKSSVVLCKPHTGRTHQIRVHLQFLGHPIINDPLYNSYVFGELKARSGLFEKPIEQLLDELFEEQSSKWNLGKKSENNISSEHKYLNFSVFKENYCIKNEMPSLKKDCSKIIHDKECYFCSTPNHSPVQNSLGLFLHAYKYAGEKWSFESKKPFWASEDWNIA